MPNSTESAAMHDLILQLTHALRKGAITGPSEAVIAAILAICDEVIDPMSEDELVMFERGLEALVKAAQECPATATAEEIYQRSCELRANFH